jgi:hypothetical protein
MAISSVIIYKGPSLIDGSPIICVVTGLGKPSHNIKTGDMIQTYIIRSDCHPNNAIHDGRDYAICGACKHRGDNGKNRTCYVRMDAPSSVYRTYQRGNYPIVSPDSISSLVKGRALRIGTYGDPTAIPEGIFAPLISVASRVTGYTHRHTVTPRDKYAYLMASVETEGEKTLAQMRGKRYFRVISSVSERAKGEVLCPASAEMGHKTTCERCALCDARRRGPSVVIVAHGAGKTHFA